MSIKKKNLLELMKATTKMQSNSSINLTKSFALSQKKSFESNNLSINRGNLSVMKNRKSFEVFNLVKEFSSENQQNKKFKVINEMVKIMKEFKIPFHLLENEKNIDSQKELVRKVLQKKISECLEDYNDNYLKRIKDSNELFKNNKKKGVYLDEMKEKIYDRITIPSKYNDLNPKVKDFLFTEDNLKEFLKDKIKKKTDLLKTNDFKKNFKKSYSQNRGSIFNIYKSIELTKNDIVKIKKKYIFNFF